MSAGREAGETVDGARGADGGAGAGGGADRGSLAIEAAILVPAIALLFSLAIIIGRLEMVSSTVDEAARVGARTASLDRSGQSPQTVAEQAVKQALSENGVTCRPAVTVNAAVVPLDAGPVPLNAVRVDVSCPVEVNDLFVVWVPGEVTLTGSFTSVIDRFRSQ
ncbi:TadE/TadG family type IV pilus assembly protein [Kitasatospora kifunensis]|uniref:Flp pilus assembly protein TadG n=1 Tax=Kitasatospora kifunensis TaxID=58351 RepID=A0A7W7VXN5_KITKI|nr:TadE family protein [Kitasatospora kifunensis]MBB4926701.1 Flp pilus assembly protein TadG [Kitasatospora kifunensis]